MSAGEEGSNVQSPNPESDCRVAQPLLHPRQRDLQRQSDRDKEVGSGGLSPLAPTKLSIFRADDADPECRVPSESTSPYTSRRLLTRGELRAEHHDQGDHGPDQGEHHRRLAGLTAEELERPRRTVTLGRQGLARRRTTQGRERTREVPEVALPSIASPWIVAVSAVNFGPNM